MTFEEILQSFPAANDYLSVMFLIRRDEGHIAHSRIASWLNVSRSAVTQAVNRLKNLELIQQERYGHITLTESGELFAKKLLRRHYLLEHFLMKNLGMTWNEIDEEAKHLQNNISDNFAEKMYAVLGKPQTCPHGNPIPDSPGEKEILAAPPISLAEAGAPIVLVRITEEGEETDGLLSFVYDNAIELGDTFTICAHTEDGSTISRKNARDLFIPVAYAVHLRYREAP